MKTNEVYEDSYGEFAVSRSEDDAVDELAEYCPKGTTVIIDNVNGNNQKNRGQYIGLVGELLDDARIGPEAGWDVYDIRLHDGRETFAHGFNLRKHNK